MSLILCGCRLLITAFLPEKIVSVIEKDLDLEEVEEYDEEGYVAHDHGYVTYETDGVFIALYCTKDMTLWVKAHSDDSIDDAKEFLKDLGMPTE